jgi:hypothetical protein
MLRALLVALLLLATPASARVLVVTPISANEYGGDPGNFTPQHMFAMREQARGILDAFGVEYDVVPSSIARTEFVRTGVMTFNFGTSAAFTRSYDAVIHLTGQTMSITSVNRGYRPDSLFSSTKAPQVPQLFWTWSYLWSGASASCAGCSLGVQRTSGYNGNTNWQGVTVFDAAMKYKARVTHVDGYTLSYVFPGTVRNLVGQKTNASLAQEVIPTDGAPCMDCDSLSSANTVGDTTLVYSVEHTVTGQPIIVCTFGHNHYDQSSPIVGAMGLAALDSLTSGAVIKKKLTLGIYLAGGLRRSSRTTWGGISPDDSTNYKASLDSLRTLGVPITVGVNLAADTITTYASDLAWFRNNLGGMASYVPENWQSISDSTKGGGNASLTAPIDPTGLYRKRAQYGDSLTHAVTGSDTSTAHLMRSAFTILRGHGLKVDHIYVGPLFDHRPITTTGDSVFFGLRKAWVRGVLVDVNNANAYGARANPRAYFTRSGFYRVGSMAPERMAVIGAWTMRQDSSAASWYNGLSVDSYSAAFSWGASTEAFWDSAFEAWGPISATTPNKLAGRAYSDFEQVGRPDTRNRARVFVIAASDLGSGIRSDAATRPTRPGWWAVKSIVNGARIANSLAGRPIIQFVPIQDIEP